jgi:hypothetical protein
VQVHWASCLGQLHRGRFACCPLELKRRRALLLLERGSFDGMAMEVGRGSFI